MSRIYPDIHDITKEDLPQMRALSKIEWEFNSRCEKYLGYEAIETLSKMRPVESVCCKI